MKSFLLLDADLSLYDGEGASASGDSMGEQINTQVTTQPAPSVGTRTEEEGDIKTTSDALEEKRKAWNELRNGEYKDFFTEDTQRIIDRRFKESKQLESRLNEQQDIMDMLYSRYGVNDVKALQEAIDNDDSYWEEAAMDAGMSVEQFKNYSKLERENRKLIEAERQRLNQDRAARQMRQWYAEAEQVKQQFPNFSLEAESENPRFIALLKSGVPVEHAFKTIHMDEILANAVTGAARSAEDKTVANIRAKGMRPAENGTSPQSGFTTKTDVNSLTKKDRAEIVKRAARGDTITF